MFPHRVTRSALLLAGVIAIATPAMAKNWGPWRPPVSVEALPGSSDLINLPTSNDGCPIQSPDGLNLFFASNRSGNLDIWVAHRDSKDVGWGEPENLGPQVNSGADDFCPAPAPGNRLFFVSKRTEPNGDIYMTRLTKEGWTAPVNLGPNVNSPQQEWSPSYFEDEQGRGVLYFSSTRAGGQDIYESIDLAPALPVVSLNTGSDDARPNVSKDGLEIVFDSTRPGGIGGLPDIWTAHRASTSEPWSDIIHLENGINTAAAETRATLSWDGSTLLFGSTRNGGPADIFVSTREKVTGKDK